MKVGYARVSTTDQNPDLQIDALESEGCTKIFKDYASGAKSDREGLEQALEFMREGDTLVVWRLDRLGRSLTQLIETVNILQKYKKFFKSLQENIDTRSPGGKLIFHIFGALAEFERDIIRERTLAGLAAARDRGRIGGRPRKLDENNISLARSLMDEKKIALAKSLHDDPSNSIGDICEILDISKSTLYRYLEED